MRQQYNIPGVCVTFSDSAVCSYSAAYTVQAPSYDYVVDAGGSGDFTTLELAFAGVTATANSPKTILIKSGSYTQTGTLTQPAYTTVVGESTSGVVIEGNRKKYAVSSGCYLGNLTYTDIHGDYGEGATGITIPNGTSDSTIENCIISTTEWCIFGDAGAVGAPYNITIRNNELRGANPIYMTGGLENSLIEDNTGEYNLAYGSLCLAFIDAVGAFNFNTICNNNLNLSRTASGVQSPYIIRFTGVGNTLEGNTLSVEAIDEWYPEGLIIYQGVSDLGRATDILSPNTIRNETYSLTTNLQSDQVYLVIIKGSYAPASVVGYADLVLENNNISYHYTVDPDAELGEIKSSETSIPHTVTVNTGGTYGSNLSITSITDATTLVHA